MPAILAELAAGAITTIQISVGAWGLAAVLGLVIALLVIIGPNALRSTLEGVILVLRSVPQLVVLYLTYFGLGQVGINVNPLAAAILTLGVTEASFVAEYYRSALMTVPQSQHDAGRSIGLSPLGVMRLVVLPQALPVAIPPLLNVFVALLKIATLASAVGAPEILYRGRNIITRTGDLLPTLTVIVILYVLATVPMTRVVAQLERRVQRQMRGYSQA